MNLMEAETRKYTRSTSKPVIEQTHWLVIQSSVQTHKRQFHEKKEIDVPT